MNDEKKDLFVCLSAADCPEYRTNCTDGVGAVCGHIGSCEACTKAGPCEECKYNEED